MAIKACKEATGAEILSQAKRFFQDFHDSLIRIIGRDEALDDQVLTCAKNHWAARIRQRCAGSHADSNVAVLPSSASNILQAPVNRLKTADRPCTAQGLKLPWRAGSRARI
ncbi:MAG TPA: hypothetical protein VED83_05550 [Burkholderiaceae bacterium]|nr:hypothetical protein [Burkholderiaceae bacterium]